MANGFVMTVKPIGKHVIVYDNTGKQIISYTRNQWIDFLNQCYFATEKWIEVWREEELNETSTPNNTTQTKRWTL